MTAAARQIVSAFETCGMSPDEIAEDQELEPLAVKACLMQFSPMYKNELKNAKEQEVEFSADDHVAAVDVIRNIAKYSEDERLQLKAATYIRDDKKGRLDAIKQLGGLNINVLQFNETMKKAIAATNRAKGLVEVSSEVTSTQ
jgi:hypothetical protein